MRKKIIYLFVLLLGFILWNYFFLIPINFRYLDSVLIFIIISFIIYVIIDPKKLIDYKYVDSKNFNSKSTYSKVPILGNSIFFVGIFMMVTILMYTLFSSTLFFSNDYKDLIGEVIEYKLDDDFIFNDVNNLPVIDSDLAKILGDKKIGEDRGLGSEFSVGEFSDIIYNEEAYAVAPLEFNDIIKWFNNMATPGYVLVNKQTGDTQLIRSIDGVDLELKYMPSAFFNNDLLRHTYFNSNMDNSLSSYHFEIDDDGYPYWIVIKTNKNIGIAGGIDVIGIAVVNAMTGEVNNYSVDDVPSWVDIIYYQDLVLDQLDDWGYYVNGFFNTVFSEKEIIRITNGSRRLYYDGDIYHYTGLTSAGADESTVGFAFVNAKTKETLFYAITGATEKAAMASAKGAVQDLGYDASFPIPINIENEPSFFITLKDASGLIKQYSFVNINDYGKVGIGSSISEARTNYLKLLNKENTSTDLDFYSSKIERIGYSNNNYYLILEGVDILFYSDIDSINKILAISMVGDYIEIYSLNDSIKVIKNEMVGIEND